MSMTGTHYSNDASPEFFPELDGLDFYSKNSFLTKGIQYTKHSST